MGMRGMYSLMEILMLQPEYYSRIGTKMERVSEWTGTSSNTGFVVDGGLVY
jgi:hypothetical protein